MHGDAEGAALSVGYIGLGTMGEPMARNVLAAGLDLWVHDINGEAVQRLVDAGAAAASDPGEMAEHCSIVLINVVNDAQVEEVVCAQDVGLLPRLRQGSVVVVHSTIHPDTCRRLAARLAEKGIGFVDAPFTGGAAAAAAGKLSLLAGGTDRDIEAVRAVLETEGTIMHVGGVGAGETAKLCNNLALAITVHAVHESLQLAEGAGLKADVALNVLQSGAADCWVARNWDAIGNMTANYPRGAQGLAALTNKDLTLALDVAQSSGLHLRITEQAATGLEDPYSSALRMLMSNEGGGAD